MAVLTRSSQGTPTPVRNRQNFPLGSIDTVELIRGITRMVKRETNLGVQELNVFVEDGKFVLEGHCMTFYTKQLAQQAAMSLLGVTELVNRIRVI